MTFLLKQIFQLIKMLNSETGTNQIASGLALGFILGMSPILSLQGILILLLMILFRVQFGAASLAAFFFAFVAYLLDPLFHLVGDYILHVASLQGIFTELYNMPLVPLTRFNNTVVMGSGVLGFALCIPLFFLFKYLIATYREQVVAKFKETKFWKSFQLTSFYKWYCTYDTYFS
jgi:uncharacterized protein (TIGR03546 family)